MSSNVIEQYYRGITQRLRSEVDFINDIFHHQGVKGAGNETVLRDLSAQFIPIHAFPSRDTCA